MKIRTAENESGRASACGVESGINPGRRFGTRAARRVLGAVCLCLAAADAFAQKAKEGSFERFDGTYKGKLVLSQPPAAAVRGRSSGKLRARKNGIGGELELRSVLVVVPNRAIIQRDLNFSRRTFRSSSLLA
jgi:hypothetical protein